MNSGLLHFFPHERSSRGLKILVSTPDIWYTASMKKSLIETNPYLKDPEQRKKLLRRSLVSSFAIEGIHLKEEPAGSVKEETPSFTARKHSRSAR